MRSRRIAAILLILGLVGAACGSDIDGGTASSTSTPGSTPSSSIPSTTVVPDPSLQEVRLDLPRAEVDPGADAIAAVVAGDRALGLDVFEAVAGGGNVMVSPYSIATALSMLLAGTEGTTADQIAEVLDLEVDQPTLHEVRNVIEAALAAEPPPQPLDDERAPFQLRPANSIWGQRDYAFSDEYLTTLAEHYGAGLRILDFGADPDGSRQAINGWVEDTTEDRIRDLIPEGAIDTLTRLVLVNAVWFKANWADQFNEEATADATFTRLDASTVSVPFMNGGQPARFKVGDGYTAVRLPFAGDASMVFVLPDEGTSPAELSQTVGPDLFSTDGWEFRSVMLSIPKFEFDSDVPLGQVLKGLGMTAAFDPAVAQLDPITGGPNDLFVSDALHKSFIAVDESGAEAAAATAIIVGATSAGPEPATFVADRPFLFWIEHTSTGEPLFLGQVIDPS